MYYFIRHGEKQYRNKDRVSPRCKQLDSPLKQNAHIALIDTIEKFLQRNNHVLPSKIVCSPYLRTRQTAEIIRDYIFEKYNVYLEIGYNFMITEYLGQQNMDRPMSELFSASTLKLFKPSKCSLDVFRSKLRIFCDNIKQYPDHTLFVTHGYCIYNIKESFHREGEFYYI